MKNEEMVIGEWIQHYIDQGADEIFVIDNGSTDNSKFVVESMVSNGRVHYIYLPEKWNQKEHYWSVINKFKIRNRFQWLLIADIDEYWFVKDGRQIPEALSDFNETDVIYVNWMMFGSNGHQAQPESVRAAFTKRNKDLGSHKFTKWICRTSCLKEFSQLQIHKIKKACSSRTISANETFQMNHYMIQSREYFSKVKMPRGDAYNPIHDSTRNWEYFEKIDQNCTVNDFTLRDRVAGSTSE